jgi:RelA/SpoT family (p)ppGpp synthetase
MVYYFETEKDEESGYGVSPEADLKRFLNICATNLADHDEELITKAYWKCYESHKDILRKSGFPYYTHPLRVATILLTEFPTSDKESVAACLLHDTIEDVDDISKDSIEIEFGSSIAELVDGVTKIRHEETSKSKNTASTYRKLFLALVKDIRVILIKLADRLHNIRTLHYMEERKQIEIAKETLYFYTPLAHRLGLTKIKMELENLSFLFSDPQAYESIKSALSEKRRDFLIYIEKFVSLIDKALNSAKIKHVTTVVHKHEYEIYEMINRGKRLEDIDNFYSVVVVLDSNDITNCYKAHGVIANAFNTVSFVDYISSSKPDWYKSLYTEIFGPDGKKVELLIRTSEMERSAEEGFASKYSLELGRKRAIAFSDEDIQLWGEWMHDIIEKEGDAATQIIWNSIKVNLFDHELVVFSESGERYQLPEGATIIDYAFSKSDFHGIHLVSAKVNGHVKDITYQLRNGDKIELFTSDSSYPKPEWQDYVVTKTATLRLFYYFEDQLKKNPIKLKPQEVSLRFLGEDREGMLRKITKAIGLANMKKIHVEENEKLFEGNLSLSVHSENEINRIILKILLIDGIIKVERAA